MCQDHRKHRRTKLSTSLCKTHWDKLCKFPHTTVLTRHHSHCIAVRARPTELTGRAVGVLVVAASRTIRTSEPSSVCAGVGPCRTVAAVLRTRTRLETVVFARNILGLAFQGLERSGLAYQALHGSSAGGIRTHRTLETCVVACLALKPTFQTAETGCCIGRVLIAARSPRRISTNTKNYHDHHNIITTTAPCSAQSLHGERLSWSRGLFCVT